MKYIFTPQFIAHHLELTVLPTINDAYFEDTINKATEQYTKAMEWYQKEHWLVKVAFGGKPQVPNIEKLRREHDDYNRTIQSWIDMFRFSKAEFVSLDYTELCRYKLTNNRKTNGKTKPSIRQK